MPSREEHLNLAHHHEALISHLNPEKSEFLDWVIAASFWAALNYIDAVLALEDSHPKRDRDRDRSIVDHPALSKVRYHYRELKGYYENAMGRGKKYTYNDYELTMVTHLRNIKGGVTRFLDLWDKKRQKDSA